MTDGERLVWATSYSFALELGADVVAAVRGATRAVLQLREVAIRRRPIDGTFVISQADERELLDEIVNVP